MTKRILVLSLVLASCQLFDKKKPDDDPAPPVTSAPTVPPQTYNATPVSSFAEAGLEGKSPLEQARAYDSTGQLWLARLVLEPKALGDDGTKEEAELLGSICARQGDADCVEKASRKAGHKIAFDAGPPQKIDPGLHTEPDNDAAKARAMAFKGDLAGAHKLLEPKVLAGKASKEEIRMLRTVCEREGDQKMCVALCDAKLK